MAKSGLRRCNASGFLQCKKLWVAEFHPVNACLGSGAARHKLQWKCCNATEELKLRGTTGTEVRKRRNSAATRLVAQCPSEVALCALG